MSDSLKTVLITGASSGIGAQLAKDYHDSGWHVIACARNEEKLAAELPHSSRIEHVCYNVTVLEEVRQALNSMKTQPDLWILNAGTCEYINQGELEPELFKRVFDTNFFGVIHCLSFIQSNFKPGCRVAIVGSIAGHLALPRAEAYGASKAAIMYLFESLSIDWQHKDIHLSAIYPGFVDTPLTRKNDFTMPMQISVKEASSRIRQGLERGQATLYLPRRFTTMIRIIAALPFVARRKWLSILNRN